MTREEFRKWRGKLTMTRMKAVDLIIVDCIFGDVFPEGTPASEIRKYVYDKFPEWH